MVQHGRLSEPFDKLPPQGDLRTLPSFLMAKWSSSCATRKARLQDVAAASVQQRAAKVVMRATDPDSDSDHALDATPAIAQLHVTRRHDRQRGADAADFKTSRQSPQRSVCEPSRRASVAPVNVTAPSKQSARRGPDVVTHTPSASLLDAQALSLDASHFPPASPRSTCRHVEPSERPHAFGRHPSRHLRAATPASADPHALPPAPALIPAPDSPPLRPLTPSSLSRQRPGAEVWPVRGAVHVVPTMQPRVCTSPTAAANGCTPPQPLTSASFQAASVAASPAPTRRAHRWNVWGERGVLHDTPSRPRVTIAAHRVRTPDHRLMHRHHVHRFSRSRAPTGQSTPSTAAAPPFPNMRPHAVGHWAAAAAAQALEDPRTLGEHPDAENHSSALASARADQRPWGAAAEHATGHLAECAAAAVSQPRDGEPANGAFRTLSHGRPSLGTMADDPLLRLDTDAMRLGMRPKAQVPSHGASGPRSASSSDSDSDSDPGAAEFLRVLARYCAETQRLLLRARPPHDTSGSRSLSFPPYSPTHHSHPTQSPPSASSPPSQPASQQLLDLLTCSRPVLCAPYSPFDSHQAPKPPGSPPSPLRWDSDSDSDPLSPIRPTRSIHSPPWPQPHSGPGSDLTRVLLQSSVHDW